MNAQESDCGILGWILDEAIRPDTKLRQGDLVVFRDETNEIKKRGIVVTADCDIANNKHARVATLVPILTPKAILEYYLIPEDCEKRRATIFQYACGKCGIDQEQESEAKLAILKKHYQEGRFSNTETTLALQVIFDDFDHIPLHTYFELMRAIESPVKQAPAIKSQIRNRGDLMVLPDPSRLGIGGCIAWVRHIWQVKITDIAMRTSEIAERPGERLARLDSPYRYRLTQLMAHVFSDIGLPDNPNFIDELIEKAYKDV